MAMSAALRRLSANFLPRLPQLSSAAQVGGTRLLWRSGCPRKLSSTPSPTLWAGKKKKKQNKLKLYGTLMVRTSCAVTQATRGWTHVSDQKPTQTHNSDHERCSLRHVVDLGGGSEQR